MTIQTEVPFGPTGEVVYNRTYSRTKANGSKETWPETAQRVARGNLALVYGGEEKWSDDVRREFDELVREITNFGIIPAGRHLWASGVRGRQYLFNCHVAGWHEKLSDHFEFTLLRLAEGGGVGANYSERHLEKYGMPRRWLQVHVVCDPAHPDYQAMQDAGLLSKEFSHEWEGAFPVEDSREGWAAALVDLIDTYMTDDKVQHTDRVYDLSRVRAKGQPLRTFGGTASGPQPFARLLHEASRVMNESYLSYTGTWIVGEDCPISMSALHVMEIDHAIGECIVSGGVRRSARMSILHWRDWDIFDFIECKADTGKHWTTNISVEIDHEFFRALSDPLHTDRSLARSVHAAVVHGMLNNGEPGYWNSTLSNHGEVNPVTATNPCGELPLPEWGACVLGHVNLDAYANRPEADLIRAHELMTRFLIRATFGDANDPKQAAVIARDRRIGVGHLGVQGYLAKNGVRYSKATETQWFKMLLCELYGTVRSEARDYAFELRIPEPIKTTTIAPTGSIAKLPGVTEGIHPIYARHFLRRVRFNNTDPEQARTLQQAEADGFKVEIDMYDRSGNTYVVVYPTKDKLVAEVEALGLPADLVESADEISVRDMLAFQKMYQTLWADNAVSMTVNVPDGKVGHAELAEALKDYLPYLKGTTVMVDGTRPQAPYTRITAEEFEAYNVSRVEDGTDEECSSGACPIR